MNQWCQKRRSGVVFGKPNRTGKRLKTIEAERLEAMYDIVEELPQIWDALVNSSDGSCVYDYDFADHSRCGVALNAWIGGMLQYCEAQCEPSRKELNRCMLHGVVFEAMYEELEYLLPALRYCYMSGHVVKDGVALDRGAEILYDWMSETSLSHVRMVTGWQSQSAASFLAHVCMNRAMTWMYRGGHTAVLDSRITLADFQKCIRCGQNLRADVVDTASGSADSA